MDSKIKTNLFIGIPFAIYNNVTRTSAQFNFSKNMDRCNNDHTGIHKNIVCPSIDWHIFPKAALCHCFILTPRFLYPPLFNITLSCTASVNHRSNQKCLFRYRRKTMQAAPFSTICVVYVSISSNWYIYWSVYYQFLFIAFIFPNENAWMLVVLLFIQVVMLEMFLLNW